VGLESVHAEEDTEQAAFQLLEKGHGNGISGLEELFIVSVSVDDELGFVQVTLHITSLA